MSRSFDRRAMFAMLSTALPLKSWAGAKQGAKLKILILCTGNSCRSQMTEAFLQSFDPRLEVHSAGTAPSDRVHPYAIRAMSEVGIDISGRRPKNANQFVAQPFDYVITVCDEADKNCPYFSGKVGKRMHIGFPDPAAATGSEDEILAVFRKTRDDIRARFRELYDQEIKAKLS